VFAFAGRAGAALSVADPIGDLESSCRAQLILLDAVRDLAPEAALVFPGSRLEYGRAEYLPMDERHPLSGDSPYAVHKSACAAYYRQYAARDGLRACVLRFGNPYGPHPVRDSFLGFGILNHFVDVALRGGTIELFGGGGQLRDFLFVDDAASAALLAAEKADGGAVLNIGSGEGVSLAAAARAAVDAVGSGDVRVTEWPAEYETVETGDYYFDVREAERTLGWRPRTSLEDGLRATIDAARATL
jgi:UDP-glucose 4-epimerase